MKGLGAQCRHGRQYTERHRQFKVNMQVAALWSSADRLQNAVFPEELRRLTITDIHA